MWQSFRPLMAVVYNLLLAYVVYFIARVAYLVDNWSYFGSFPIGEGVEGASPAWLSWEMWKGGLMFDTSAILVTNSLYILLMLLPLNWKGQWTWWHGLCKWLFIGVNSFSFAICLADAAYFPYTMRRTTTTVFREFQNEDNIWSIIATETLHHWYFVVLAVAVAMGLWKMYKSPLFLSSNEGQKCAISTNLC